MAKLVSKTYGDALFAVAVEEQRMDELFEATKVVVQVLREQEDFCKLMTHPKIAKEEKIALVEGTLKDRIPRELIGMMVLLITKGHTGEFLPVFEHFIALVKEEKRIGTAYVTTAIALSEEKRAQVEVRILETSDYQSLEVVYTVDEALLGGMVIRIGDRVVDSSIQTKLYKLSKELKQIQLS